VSNATVQISPHVIVSASDPNVPELRAAWAWASKRHISLATSAGDVEFSRWVEIATVSPYRDLFKGQLYREFGSMMPDYRIGGAFNQNEKVLLTTTALGAVVFFSDPRSLLGVKPEDADKLVPEGFSGRLPLKKGPGWKYIDSKGRTPTRRTGGHRTASAPSRWHRPTTDLPSTPGTRNPPARPTGGKARDAAACCRPAR
jgi:hypothetical protein